MQVLLRHDVYKLGKRGQQVRVRDGFARNYLIPQGFAVECTAGNLKQFEYEKKRLEKEEAAARAQFQQAANSLEGHSLNIEMAANEEGRLFGSVNAAVIARHLKEAGFPVEDRMVLLENPIKTIGIYTLKVRFTSGLEPEIKLWVVDNTKPAAAAVEEPAPAQAAEGVAQSEEEPKEESK